MPVPLFPRHAGGPSQKGTGTVAGGRTCIWIFIKATEPVPFYDCRSSNAEVEVTPTAKKHAKKTAEADPNERSIAQNRKAYHNFEVLDTLECGIILVGSEVKSLREGRVSLEEAYARIKEDEVWLVGCDIAEYFEANQFNHPPRRPRKLLLHRREVKQFAHRAYEKGLTLVPLKMYFKRGLAKVLVGLCRGKQLHDKREAMKKSQVHRDLQRMMMKRR